jgi:signal transduction histidine kinase
VRYTHWIDIFWYLVLIGLSAGATSIFFFLFFLAILIGSFRYGYAEGLRVTAFSVVLFVIVGYLTTPTGEDFELNRLLIRPIYLSILGYMIAFWGGREIAHRSRLEILKDINKLYNPRFGVDQTLAAILQKILVSFNGDSCLLIARRNGSNFLLRQCYRENPQQAVSPEQIDAESPLIKLPGENAVIYDSIRQIGFGNTAKYFVFDPNNELQVNEPLRNGEVIADLLETRSFISVPLCRHGMLVWRLYLTSRRGTFDYLDIEFLRQMLEQSFPVVENVSLLDHLASEATEEQRRKISRDIHDSTIQPYIGIKFGLEALQLKNDAGENIKDEISQIINLAETNIRDIRSYVNRLRGDKADIKTGNVLVSAIRQQAKKISEFYGIRIEIFAEDDQINISDRLSAEVFQMISESLSNVKRHTKSDYALIRIDSDDQKLKLEIQNNNPDGESAGEFVPKSLKERANALGGQVFVRNDDNQTTVAVEIPL